MSDAPSKYRTICRCSHDKSSHYETKYGCLAARCDCSKYVDSLDAKATEEQEVTTSASELSELYYTKFDSYDDYMGADFDDPPPSWY